MKYDCATNLTTFFFIFHLKCILKFRCGLRILTSWIRGKSMESQATNTLQKCMFYLIVVIAFTLKLKSGSLFFFLKIFFWEKITIKRIYFSWFFKYYVHEQNSGARNWQNASWSSDKRWFYVRKNTTKYRHDIKARFAVGVIQIWRP